MQLGNGYHTDIPSLDAFLEVNQVYLLPPHTQPKKAPQSELFSGRALPETWAFCSFFSSCTASFRTSASTLSKWAMCFCRSGNYCIEYWIIEEKLGGFWMTWGWEIGQALTPDDPGWQRQIWPAGREALSPGPAAAPAWPTKLHGVQGKVADLNTWSRIWKNGACTMCGEWSYWAASRGKLTKKRELLKKTADEWGNKLRNGRKSTIKWGTWEEMKHRQRWNAPVHSAAAVGRRTKHE